MLAFLDNLNEALAGILRTGRAGSNIAADHITVLEQALTQLPDHTRAGQILVRTPTVRTSPNASRNISSLSLMGAAWSTRLAIRSPRT